MSGRLEKKLRRLTNRSLTEEATAFIKTIYLNKPKYFPRLLWLDLVDYVMSRYKYVPHK